MSLSPLAKLGLLGAGALGLYVLLSESGKASPEPSSGPPGPAPPFPPSILDLPPPVNPVGPPVIVPPKGPPAPFADLPIGAVVRVFGAGGLGFDDTQWQIVSKGPPDGTSLFSEDWRYIGLEKTFLPASVVGLGRSRLLLRHEITARVS